MKKAADFMYEFDVFDPCAQYYIFRPRVHHWKKLNTSSSAWLVSYEWTVVWIE